MRDTSKTCVHLAISQGTFPIDRVIDKAKHTKNLKYLNSLGMSILLYPATFLFICYQILACIAVQYIQITSSFLYHCYTIVSEILSICCLQNQHIQKLLSSI